MCGGPGCKDINVKFTCNPQNAHDNHYDSIVTSPKPPSMECCLYSDVVKKPIKHEQPMNIKRGTEMNPIVIDDFPLLETIKQEIIPKDESNNKQEIEELPLDLSMPKKPQSGNTEENNISGMTNNEPAENFENVQVKEEPSAVAVNNIISDVTYISDDGEDLITILDDHPTRPNNMITPVCSINISHGIDSNVSDINKNYSLYSDSIDSTTNLPLIGSGNYFPVWLFEDVEPIHVDQLPHNINRKNIYFLQSNAGNWKLKCQDKHHFIMTSSS